MGETLLKITPRTTFGERRVIYPFTAAAADSAMPRTFSTSTTGASSTRAR